MRPESMMIIAMAIIETVSVVVIVAATAVTLAVVTMGIAMVTIVAMVAVVGDDPMNASNCKRSTNKLA
jgi:hypothetical protein